MICIGKVYGNFFYGGREFFWIIFCKNLINIVLCGFRLNCGYLDGIEGKKWCSF